MSELQGRGTRRGMVLGDADIGDGDLIAFALDVAGHAPAAAQLLAEFGDVEIILASAPEDLRTRGGLSDRAVGVIKLLHAFRADSRRGRLLH